MIEIEKPGILDGKETARAVRAEVAQRVEGLKKQGVQARLSVVLVGEDPASKVYVKNKDKAAVNAGFEVETHRLAATTSTGELLELVKGLNAAREVNGILIQLPLPKGIDARAVLHAIDPEKDVDGLHPANVGALWRDEPGLVPCTPAGCIEILDRHGIEIEGKRAVVIGRSSLVGKPVAALLLRRNATVTICHSRTPDLAAVTREADIVVAAVGRAGLVKGDWIRPGAVVLDVGINRGGDGRLHGDVVFSEVHGVAAAVTPVPGGIGPMTIAMLLQNTAYAAARQNGVIWESTAPPA